MEDDLLFCLKTRMCEADIDDLVKFSTRELSVAEEHILQEHSLTAQSIQALDDTVSEIAANALAWVELINKRLMLVE